MSKRLFVSSFATILLSAMGSAHGQVAAAATAGAVAAAPHLVGAAPAILTGAVSSVSAHAGQAVLAKFASPTSLSNGLKLPTGSQLLGHVTSVTPLSQGNGRSSLSMLFDRVRTAGGKESPLASSSLQSLDPSPSKRQASTGNSASASAQQNGNSNGGLLGGVVGSVGDTVSGTLNATGQLLGTVTGLPGVLLTSAGTLNAKGRDISVPAGTRISVGADVQAGQQR